MRLSWLAAAALLLAACTGEPEASPTPSSSASSSDGPVPDPVRQSDEPAVVVRAHPNDVRKWEAMRAVRHLSVRIGPRPGTTRAYHEAAEWVADQFRGLGFDVQQQSFPVPGGASVAGPTAGLPVEAGRSTNVIASLGELVPEEPWLLVGAHLDTVPTSPGAEDNGSGVGALLAVAEAIHDRKTRLPVVLVAFGAEEPRGPGDDDHHYGSRAYVAALTKAERRSLQGMVAMDRVGVGTAVPVGSVEDGDPLRAELLDAAREYAIPTVAEAGQRSSDHWSFVREGLPGVRLGSTPYAGYHSADDVIGVVQPIQVVRAARLVVAWIR